MSFLLPQRMGSEAFTVLLAGASTPPAVPQTRYLHAGQVCVSASPQTIVFILGSCVGVCLWDPVSKVGGATHFLLPESDGRSASSARYGNVAIPVLLHKLAEAGAHLDRLRAKVFGGGRLLNLTSSEAWNASPLGTRNAEVAVEILRKHHIPIEISELGGTRGKRISFQSDTGETIVKEL